MCVFVGCLVIKQYWLKCSRWPLYCLGNRQNMQRPMSKCKENMCAGALSHQLSHLHLIYKNISLLNSSICQFKKLFLQWIQRSGFRLSLESEMTVQDDSLHWISCSELCWNLKSAFYDSCTSDLSDIWLLKDLPSK